MDWKYIAGFFDGEGTIAHNGKGFRITITQTNEDVLEAIRRFTSSGYIVEITKRKKHWKDSWLFYIAKQKDVYNFIANIKDYLIVKEVLAKKTLIQLKAYLKVREKQRLLKENRIKHAKVLRMKGWSYRKMGKQLNTDYGYIRRLLLKKTVNR